MKKRIVKCIVCGGIMHLKEIDWVCMSCNFRHEGLNNDVGKETL